MGRRSKGEGSIFRRPGVETWTAQWFVNGKAIRKTTGKKIKEEAYAQLRKFMADTEAGKAVVDGRLRYGVLRQALIDDYVRKGNALWKCAQTVPKPSWGYRSLTKPQDTSHPRTMRWNNPAC